MKLNLNHLFIFILSLLLDNNGSNTVFSSAENLVEKAKKCEPKSCGNGLNISYPFWLYGQQPSYCGYPLLNLTCNETSNNSPPVLNILSRSFYIKDIFYNNQSFILTSAEFADESCPIPYVNFTVTDTYPLSISNTNDVVFFLINCSNAMVGYDYENISCGGNGHLNYYGGFYDDRSEVEEGCQLVTMPVVRNYEVKGEEFVGVLRSGLVMNWSFPSCSECKESGGKCGYNETESNFMCICSDKISCGAPISTSKKMKLKIVIAVAVIVTSLFLSSFLVYLVLKRKHWMMDKKSVEDFVKNCRSIAPKLYTYSKIKRITKSFSNKLGEGGYGSVFLGTLQDGQLVAVKLLTKTTSNGEEFTNEVASISRTSHVNIVSLLGYCLERSKRALVYEYMPNGSLDNYIYGDKSKLETQLNWQILYDIFIGIARGLEYLHRGCNTRIVHFDIKPHNILLDKNFVPKISDFGLAKLGHQNMSKISMVGARGTVGYIAPELVSRSFGEVTSKSDVYSFGMMMLEMVAGRKNFDGTIDKSSEIYFPHWIHDHLGQYCNLDNFELTIETEEMARKMIIVSLLCIQTLPANRPSMSMVVGMLEGNIDDLQMPPKQNLF